MAREELGNRLYKNILYKNRSNSKITSKDYFIPKVRKSDSSIKGEFELFLRKIFFKLKKDQMALKILDYEFLKNHSEFIEFSWNMVKKYQIKDHNNIDNRLRVSANLLSYYITYQAISNSNSEKLCLTDESIIHTSLLLFNNADEISDIEKFTELAPLPEALIYCKADIETIAKRSENRDVVLSQIGKSHIQLKQSAFVELEICDIIVEKLKSKGTKILEINTGFGIEKNSELMNDFILNL